MRVISGNARGHKLTAPPGLEVRPTSDKVKGSLFNMIHNDLYGCCFLDLFGGSGAIGIEALSRGAGFCAFVEKSREHCEYIYKNLEHVKKALGTFNHQIINSDVQDALLLFRNQQLKFDIIFMDPPYNRGLIDNTIDNIYRYEILNENGYIIVEQGSNEEPPGSEFFQVYKSREYRTASIFFLKATQ